MVRRSIEDCKRINKRDCYVILIKVIDIRTFNNIHSSNSLNMVRRNTRKTINEQNYHNCILLILIILAKTILTK